VPDLAGPQSRSAEIAIATVAPPTDPALRRKGAATWVAFNALAISAVLLVVLIGTIVAVRFVRARMTIKSRRSRTGHPEIDPWAESARRLETPPSDGDEEEPPTKEWIR